MTTLSSCSLIARFACASMLCVSTVPIAKSHAQTPSRSTATEVLTNRDVITLVSAQVPADLIIAKITSANVAFDLSTNGIIELNRGKVPSEIVRAMMTRASGAPVAGGVGSPQTPATRGITPAAADGQLLAGSDVAQPTEPGIYMYADSAGRPTLMMLEPSAYSAGKSGGYLKSALTYGIAKTKTKAVVRGEQAAIRTTDRRPVFYFVFEKTNGGLSVASGPFFGNGVTSPNEFTLIRLRVSGGGRETVVMSSNAFGSSSGTSDKSVVLFRMTRLRPGYYRVYLEQDLAPGEYCFFGTGSQAAGPGMMAVSRLWDFGIR